MYKFSDELIGQIVKLLQLALLDGTDITDHMRSVYVQPDDRGYLVLTSEYKEIFEMQLKKLLELAEQLKAQNLSETPDA